MNRVVHFEIHAKDPTAVQKFYSDVFGWEITTAGPEYGGYRMIKTGPSMPTDMASMGINGGMNLRKGDSPKDGQPVNAYVCIIGVDNIDTSIAKVMAAGGTMALDKMEVPHVGMLCYCKDPDGNLFGMLQPAPQMHP